jgi:hypothetical protein
MAGYKSGYEDAKYVHDLHAPRSREEFIKETESEIARRTPAMTANDLYVSPGCSCPNAMYCDGACFPKVGTDWK